MSNKGISKKGISINANRKFCALSANPLIRMSWITRNILPNKNVDGNRIRIVETIVQTPITIRTLLVNPNESSICKVSGLGLLNALIPCVIPKYNVTMISIELSIFFILQMCSAI